MELMPLVKIKIILFLIYYNYYANIHEYIFQYFYL